MGHGHFLAPQTDFEAAACASQVWRRFPRYPGTWHQDLSGLVIALPGAAPPPLAGTLLVGGPSSLRRPVSRRVPASLISAPPHPARQD
jgi:hypothetical protein